MIWGQCSTAMKNKLQSLDEYDYRSDLHDCAWILQEIKGITLRFEGTRYIFLSIDNARTVYYGYVQPRSQSLADYLRYLQSLIDVMDHDGAHIGEDEVFLEKAGVLMKEEEPKIEDDTYAQLNTAYNAKKSCR